MAFEEKVILKRINEFGKIVIPKKLRSLIGEVVNLQITPEGLLIRSVRANEEQNSSIQSIDDNGRIRISTKLMKRLELKNGSTIQYIIFDTVVEKRINNVNRILIPAALRKRLVTNEVQVKFINSKMYVVPYTQDSHEKSYVRTVDYTGWLAIPIELRKKLEWTPGKIIKISKTLNNELMLQEFDQACEICKGIKKLVIRERTCFCESCLVEINERIGKSLRLHG